MLLRIISVLVFYSVFHKINFTVGENVAEFYINQIARNGYIHKQPEGRLAGSLKGTTLGGFVSSNIYLGTPTDPDSTCRTPSLISGVAVGHCKEQDGFWYKFHLTKDSCDGATVEYYEDSQCTHFSGISELGAETSVCQLSALNNDHPIYQTLTCSVAREPVVPYPAYIIRYHTGEECTGAVVAFDAYAADTCLYLSNTQAMRVNCSSSSSTDKRNVDAGVYAVASCAGSPQEHRTLSAQCLGSQQDDDHFLLPFLDPPSLAAPSLAIRSSSRARGVSQLLALESSSVSVSTQGVCVSRHSNDDSDDNSGAQLNAGALVAIMLVSVAAAGLGVYLLYYHVFLKAPYTRLQPSSLDTEMYSSYMHSSAPSTTERLL